MANRKVQTMNLQGQEYAKVPERLRLFREDCPNGSIKTEFKIDGDTLIFTAYILKDKADPNSADATGHSMAKMSNKQKEFEKQETIAIGRALAILGYLASGEVASSEEMEAFNEYKKQQEEQAVGEAIARLEEAKTMDELKKVFVSLGTLIGNEEVVAAKDKRKAELSQKEERQTKPPVVKEAKNESN